MTSSKVLLSAIIALFLGSFGGLGCGDDGATPVDAALPDSAADASGPHFDHPARVLRVIDGDTIVVSFLDQEIKIRFMGVNCPELTPTPEPYAEAAREFTIDHAQPTFTVGLEFDDESCGTIPFPDTCFDTYNRMLAYIRTPTEEDLGALLLENGLACVYLPNQDFQRRSYYLELESQAAGKGTDCSQ